MPSSIKDDSDLLNKLIEDYANAPSPWRITPYWQTYHDRMLRTIRLNGLQSLQRNYALLKGFATGGIPEPIPPANALKRAVFTTIPQLPVVSKVFASYKLLVRALHSQNIALRRQVSLDTLNLIADHFPDIQPPGDLTIGEAEDDFEWRGKRFTAAFVPYLARAADFYLAVPPATVESLLEIGPGLGWSTLAHRTLNPHLRLVVNVDIPLTLYISTQFIKATGGFTVVDYIQFLRDGVSSAKPSAGSTLPICLQLPPWSLESVATPLDYAHNAFSFQEMEPSVVSAYAKNMARLIRRGLWLMSSVEGHEPHAGGQKETVTFQMIEDSLGSVFKHIPADLATLCGRFGIKPEHTRLYSPLVTT